MNEREYLLQLVSDYVRLARSANRSIVIFRSALSLHSKNRLFLPEFRLSLIRSLSFFIRSRSNYLREARVLRVKLELLCDSEKSDLRNPNCVQLTHGWNRTISGHKKSFQRGKKDSPADRMLNLADGSLATTLIVTALNISGEPGQTVYRLLGRTVCI